MTEQQRLQKNKDIVLAFYEAAINEKDFDKARPYMTDTYLQHNPTAATGPEGLRDWLADFKKQFPKLKAHIKKVIAEGDFVVLHVYGTDGEGHSSAVVDIFRMEGDKVAEHWDVIQPIPPQDMSGNSMF